MTKTYPVGTGKKEDLTPEGVFKIGPKVKYPTWFNSEEKKVIPGWKEDFPKGKQENPLGPRWMGLIVKGDSGNTYGIHGTNNENSIGHHVSAGCIRMHVKDVIELYNIVPSGTSVWIHSGTSTGQWMKNGDSEKDVKAKEGRIKITDRVNIRQKPTTSSTSLGKAEKNSQYNITGETQDWYRIKFNGDKVGYISKAYTQIIQPAQGQNPQDEAPKPETIQASIQLKTSFTKEGALKIESSLSNIRQADGTWKIYLNGRVIHENKNNQSTYTYDYKNANLSGNEIKIRVDYQGSSEGKSITASRTQTFAKENIGMNIKPYFKENKLHIDASLKDHQKALGIWTIQLGKTSKTYLQSGEKLTAIFDSVTFNKEEFPTKVEFKGFLNNTFVTAEYEKDLKILMPNNENDQNDQEESQNEEPPEPPKTTPQPTTEPEHQEEAPNDETQKNLTSSKEQTQPSSSDQETTSEESKDEEVAQKTSSEEPKDEESEQKTTSEESKDDEPEQKTASEEPKDEDQPQQTVMNSETNDENSGSQTEGVGGELPKTATSYPTLILIGLGFIAIGIGLFVYLRYRY